MFVKITNAPDAQITRNAQNAQNVVMIGERQNTETNRPLLAFMLPAPLHVRAGTTMISALRRTGRRTNDVGTLNVGREDQTGQKEVKTGVQIGLSVATDVMADQNAKAIGQKEFLTHTTSNSFKFRSFAKFYSHSLISGVLPVKE